MQNSTRGDNKKFISVMVKLIFLWLMLNIFFLISSILFWIKIYYIDNINYISISLTLCLMIEIFNTFKYYDTLFCCCISKTTDSWFDKKFIAEENEIYRMNSNAPTSFSDV